MSLKRLTQERFSDLKLHKSAFLGSSDHPIDEESPVNKGELVDAVAKKTDKTKKDVDLIISAALETIMESVSAGEKVTLVGFGSFEPRSRQEREGRNPQTGEKMTIKASKVPAFSAGKSFKELVETSASEP